MPRLRKRANAAVVGLAVVCSMSMSSTYGLTASSSRATLVARSSVFPPRTPSLATSSCRRSLRMSSSAAAVALEGDGASFWHSHPQSRLFLARVHLAEALTQHSSSHTQHDDASFGRRRRRDAASEESSGAGPRSLSARTAEASQRFASDLGKGALATWRRQWKIILAVDVGLFALCEALCQCSPLLQSTLIQSSAAGFLSIAQWYEACIYGALWMPVRVMDGLVQAAMVVPAVFMAVPLLSKVGNLFGNGRAFNLLDAVNLESLSAGKMATTIGAKVSSSTSTFKLWLTWPLLYSSAKTFLSVPIFEELLFRVVLQGNLLRIAYQASRVRAGEADGRDDTARGDSDVSVRTAEKVAPAVKYGIRFVVALLFALLHTMNHAEALMSADAAVQWSGVFGAAMQTSVTFLASWFVYSPVYEKYGFVAAVGAHLLWNSLASFNIIRVLAVLHCASFAFKTIRNKRRASQALA